MKKRKKFHIIIPALLLLIVCAAILYLRAIEFTISAKTLLVEEIGRATGKKAFAGSIRFDFLKGLVLEDVVIYDSNTVIVRARDVSCGLLIPSLVSKKVIIPALTIEHPVIYVERRPDGSMNVFDLIPKNYVSKSGMAVSVHKVVIHSGRIDLVDKALDPAFEKKFIGVDAEIKLYLPIRAIVRAQFSIPPAAVMKVCGEYVLPTDMLTADIISESLSLKDFHRYYRSSGFSFPSGELQAKSRFISKGGILIADINAETGDLSVAKEMLKAKIDCAINARVKYIFKDKNLTCTGGIDIRNMYIDGAEGLGKLENIKGRVVFDQTRLSATDIKAEALGIVWNAKVNIVNFARPIIDIYAHAGVRLGALQKTLKSRLGMKFPNEVAGIGDLRVTMQMEQAKPAKLSGYLSFSDATASLGKGNFPIEALTGEMQFGSDGAKWDNIRCSYRGIQYKASGRLSDFAAPHVNLEVSSKELQYVCEFAMRDNVMNISRLDGRYLNSKFLAIGDICVEDPGTVDADLKGTLSIDLADIRKTSRNSAGMRKMKPAGKIAAEFELSGDVKNLKTCYVNAKMSSKRMSVYGLNFTDVKIGFAQEQGIGSIRSMRSSFYGGTISATARIDWLAKGLPYSANIDAIGVKLENLKADTDFKDKDVSGDIKVYADIKGIFKDASRLSGIGHVGLTRGRLWQLNLFKGAGSLIFSDDFSDIVFTSGAFDYIIRESSFFIDNLVMKSDLLTLYGSGRIGFNRLIEGSMRPEIEPDAASTGKLAVAVGRGTIIEVNGTLKDPQFKTKTNVINVVGAMLQQQ